MPCFCFGHSSECKSAPSFHARSVISNFDPARNRDKWTAIDANSKSVELKFNIEVTHSGDENIYFNAPDDFLGDQRASYNQFLKIKIKLVNQPEPSPSPTDIILESDGIQISLSILAQGNSLPDESYKEYVFRLHEHPDYSWQPTQSFQQFMSILSNLTAIKIRSSYSDGGQAFLNVVELETAHRTWNDGTKI